MKTRTSLIFILAVIICSSCVDEIDLNLDKELNNRLIVEGTITDNDTIQTIQLTLTASYDSDKPCPPATGAVVSVSDGSSTFLFNETKPGIYQSYGLIGVVGKTYILKILYNGKTYEASSKMHEGFPIDSIVVKRFPYGMPANQPHAEVLIWGQESPDPDQFYLFQYAINGEWKDTLIQQGLFTDFLSNGAYFDGVSIGIFASYEETVTVQARSISVEEQYFWFLDACIWNVMPNMFFSPPPANVHGNISNGAFGYFRASSIHTSEPIRVKMKELK